MPLIITIMVLTGYRGFSDFGFGNREPEGTGPEIRCLPDGEQCYLRVRGKWYIVVGVLEEGDVPIKFRINLDEVKVEDSLSVPVEEIPNQ